MEWQFSLHRADNKRWSDWLAPMNSQTGVMRAVPGPYRRRWPSPLRPGLLHGRVHPALRPLTSHRVSWGTSWGRARRSDRYLACQTPGRHCLHVNSAAHSVYVIDHIFQFEFSWVQTSWSYGRSDFTCRYLSILIVVEQKERFFQFFNIGLWQSHFTVCRLGIFLRTPLHGV